ncbi:hypothetical protein SALBM311S_03175 [Streptomyces alboniger]
MIDPQVPTAAQPRSPQPAGPETSPHLQRGTLGVADIVFFVAAAAAPLTVMAGVAPLAILFGGIGAPSPYVGTAKPTCRCTATLSAHRE